MGWLLRNPELLVITAATTLGSIAAQAMLTFFVESAVLRGVPVGQAGWLLGAGSICGLVSRLLWGWLADRREGNGLRNVGGLMVVGSLGVFGLSAAAEGLLPVATALAFAAGWGWNGLLNYTVVRRHPGSPALALSIATTGIFIGGVIGPFGFGFLARHGSYSIAWVATAVALLLAGCLVLLATRLPVTGPFAEVSANRSP